MPGTWEAACISKSCCVRSGEGHSLPPSLQVEQIPIMCKGGHRAVRSKSFTKCQESDFLCEISQVLSIGSSFQRQNKRQCKSQVKQMGNPHALAKGALHPKVRLGLCPALSCVLDGLISLSACAGHHGLHVPTFSSCFY